MRADIKQSFSRFLSAVPGRLHMAAHSHHYWPDVTFGAQAQAWTDAALHADHKWAHVFGGIMPDVRRHIARILHLTDPASIVFAQNTHEFVVRLISCLPAERPAHVLTTDSEFHSFDRQIRRLEEDGTVSVTRIATEPFESFPVRFAAAAVDKKIDMIFFSHVFFNSGFVVPDLAQIVNAVQNPQVLVVVDGYHGFMALPTDLTAIADRAFYLAGGYKYAMAGEGACFMHCPTGFGARPRNTGWFAGFGNLQSAQGGQVAYGHDGMRFAGATADVSGLYRMRAVFEWLQRENITVQDIHAHAHALQEVFLDGLNRMQNAALPVSCLMVDNSKTRGNFLAFKTPRAADICHILEQHGIITDHRGDCLRFGFGPYHDMADIEKFLEVIKTHVR